MKIDFLNFLNPSFGNKKEERTIKDTDKYPKNNIQTYAADALCNYNKGFVTKYTCEELPEIKELSDEEFEEYKTRLSEKIKTLPYDVQDTIEKSPINKQNIFLLDKILSDCDFCQNSAILEYIPAFLKSDTDLTKTSGKLYAMDRIKRENLLNIKNLAKYILCIIYYTDTIEDADSKIDLIKHLNKERLMSNKNLGYCLDSIIKHTKKMEETNAKADFVSTLKAKKLLSIKNVREFLGHMLHTINNQENADAKRSVIEQLEAKKLIDNKDVKNNIGSIICNANNKDMAEIKNKIIDELGKLEIANSGAILEYAGRIIASVNSKEELVATLKFISNKEVIKNAAIIDFAYSVSGDSNKFIEHINESDNDEIARLNKIIENKSIKKLNELTLVDIKDLNELSKMPELDLLIVNAIIDNPKIASEIAAKGTGKLYETLDYLYKNANLEEFKKYIDDTCLITLNVLQNNSGIELSGTKIVDSIDNQKNTPSNKKIKIKISTTDTNGVIQRSKSTIFDNISTTRSEHGNRISTLNKTNENYDVSSQFEIIKDKNGEPEYVIYTKESELLKGAYNTTKYRFKDYPQDTNIVEEIEKGTLEGGHIISSVRKAENGDIEYIENYKYRRTYTKRKYTQKPDGSYKYSYHINDKEGKPILSLDRSFRKNPDNTTTTVINGKKYKALYNDKKMQIIIIDDDSRKIKIDIKSKLVNLKNYTKEEKEYVKNNFGDEKNMRKEFFDFLKTVPADTLLSLNLYASRIIITSLNESGIDQEEERTLNIGLHKQALAHEMGHGIDLDECKYSALGKISGNQDVIKIYNKEMKHFKEKYTEEYQNVIKYFGQTGGGNFNNSGLSEFVAETNMLLTTYGDDNNRTKTRCQYLVRYFPKTIAKIAELLGYDK